MNTETKTQLVLRIRGLPQEIQDLIGEYNVEHRERMRQLRDEYFGIIFKTCSMCRMYTSHENYCPTDYFLYTKYGLNHYWCSKECLDDEPNESLVQNYFGTITKYLESSADLIR
jgi:hypothetical protein